MTSRLRSKQAITTFNKETKIWHGERADHVFGAHDSIGSVAISSLLNDPDHITQICYPSGKEYTNQEIATLSIRIALNLQKLNLAQRDVIGLCAANSDFVAPLTFGALLCGLSISTLDPSFDRKGIAHVYSITKPKIMFCDGDNYKSVKSALEECNLCDTIIYTVSNHIDKVPSLEELMEYTEGEKDFKAPVLEQGWNQVAMILCSSGTTGLPKGVTMSHASILNAKKFEFLPSDKFLCFSTLYWLTGLVTLVHGTIAGLTRVISNRPYSTDDFFNIVERYKVNIILSPPSQIAMTLTSDRINNCDLSSIELFMAGGSAVPYNLVKKFKQFAKNAVFLVGYGMSEVCVWISFYELDDRDSVGQLNCNVEIKIINDNGQNLAANDVGEICIRTPYPWQGYFNNPEATANTYDKDNWIHSGDLGYFDDDGNLYIIDRKKDILKYNNYHFYPTEIEKVIMELPDVVEVSVVGISDNIYTHLPAAAVVKRPDSHLSEKDVCEYVAKRMQHFEQLRGGVYFFENLPRTTSGKTLRREVTKICENIHKKTD
ncbi:4-coumarate--CoA ligase 1-like [Lucilia cuprina]|uniref:4-coumarate--CoA ligase 1-like n=1 Tax=Lucilia cuprina TaxID=7375 RepID=UPI001F068AFA|nr:4-coumarate--CoA ligase 1-like [Lucilia cuprina]